MKSSSAMFSVDATRPPTLTLDPAPNSTPLGLTMNTLPFALSVPRIAEGSDPVTRFSATDCASGWVNVTLPFAPIENDCQLTIAFCDPWLTIIWPAAGLETDADPRTTVGLLGRTWANPAAGPNARATANDAGRKCRCDG